MLLLNRRIHAPIKRPGTFVAWNFVEMVAKPARIDPQPDGRKSGTRFSTVGYPRGLAASRFFSPTSMCRRTTETTFFDKDIAEYKIRNIIETIDAQRGTRD